jgi:hypothetical protein
VIRRVALGAALAVAGCRLDLTDPIDRSRPEVSVWVSFQDSLPLTAGRVSGVLWPGIGADGLVRSVSDSMLRVAGFTIAPKTVDARGQLAYDTAWVFNGDSWGGAVVDFVAPELAGAPPPTPLRLALPWRLGAPEITLERGRDVLLPLATPGDSTAAAPGGWSLSVRNDQYVVLAVYSLGPLKLPLVVPGAWLANAPGDTLRLELSGSQFIAADNGYRVSLSAVLRMRWRVVLMEP